MSFQAELFPYRFSDFPAWLSEEQLRSHYEINYLGYVKKLNELTKIHPDIIGQSKLHLALSYPLHSEVEQNASQIINHELFWNSMSPMKQNPGENTLSLIEASFDSLEQFKKLFIDRAVGHWSNGYCWCLWDPSLRMIRVKDTSDEYNPMREGLLPLFTLDIYEHSLYLDYRTDKKTYATKFFDHINWEFVELCSKCLQ